jgi:hypothetical protein
MVGLEGLDLFVFLFWTLRRLRAFPLGVQHNSLDVNNILKLMSELEKHCDLLKT